MTEARSNTGVKALLAEHAEQSQEERVRLERDLVGMISRHSEDDTRSFTRVTEALIDLQRDVTQIRHAGIWARGAIWALVGVLTLTGVGLITVGRYAAEKWIGEIADRAVERAVQVDRWRASDRRERFPEARPTP